MTSFRDEGRKHWHIVFIDKFFIVIVSFIVDFTDIYDDKIIQEILPKHKENSIVTLIKT